MQYDAWWMWCLGLVVGFGACLGSFMNAVIYRLPRNIGLRDPLWSFCPVCDTRIRGRHNIPVVSYFMLRGRCADCRTTISPRYPLGEVLLVLVFVMLFDAFFVRGMAGITSGTWSVAYRFYTDWPVFAAHCILFACLVAMSAIDIESYWVDIRFTSLAAIMGFVAHAAWSPPRGIAWPRPNQTLGMAALCAMVGLLAMVLWSLRREVNAAPTDEALADEPPPSEDATPAPSSGGIGAAAWVAVAVAAATLLTLAITILHDHPTISLALDVPFIARILPAVGLILIVMLAASAVPRDSDIEVAEAIEAERPDARRMVLLELAWLLPAMSCGAVGLLWADNLAPLWGWSPIGRSAPIQGLATAATGFILAGALGWAVRIGFTLWLGKEAFGTGDIHIMAAAGSVAGWPVVLVGFFVSALLALIGWVLTIRSKNTHTLPMGPWLTLGIFIAVLYRDAFYEHFIERFELIITHFLPALEPLIKA